MHQLLNRAFDQAVKWGKIVNNPVSEADPPSVNYGEMFIWSFDEIHHFFEACRGEHRYLTFLLAIYTGMRRGETLGLKWGDVDFANKRIHVNRSLAHIPKSGYTLPTLKTKSSKRQIPIPDFVLSELRRHKNAQDEWKELVGDLYQNKDIVICTNTGIMQDPRNVIRVMKRIIKESKVTAICLRHTHASPFSRRSRYR